MRSGQLDRSAARIGLRLVTVVLCAAGLRSLAGCADGGSSGFDIQAQQRVEQQVITEAVQSVECVELNGTLICGAHIKSGSSTMPPALSDPVSLSPPSGEPLLCVGDATAGCTATIGITGGQLSGSSAGLQAGSTLQVAVGLVDPPRGWVRGEAVLYAEGGEAQADLQVTLVPGRRVPLVTGTRVRVAVLAYPPGAGVPDLPRAVSLLSDFDTDLAVVANDLVLQLSAEAPP